MFDSLKGVFLSILSASNVANALNMQGFIIQDEEDDETSVKNYQGNGSQLRMNL